MRKINTAQAINAFDVANIHVFYKNKYFHLNCIDNVFCKIREQFSQYSFYKEKTNISEEPKTLILEQSVSILFAFGFALL